ncbi:uncharacterized protein LOC128735109 [Sabethes cyaneus]|uniref:uncharacterized protein LOC128735109 n=1 Tax=Sabethes cyaneus TaxID=53552 RepID=UPI00237E9863|nr:uncharacterized protein LOC128735109 [Sabethes cyaneus]
MACRTIVKPLLSGLVHNWLLPPPPPPQPAQRGSACVKITRLSVPRTYILDNYHRRQQQQLQHHGGGGGGGGGPGRAIYRYDADTGTDELLPSPPRDPDSERQRQHHNEHLILDCEYEIDLHERGFVLKWYFNGKLIYQWIPPRRLPLGFTAMKHQVNRSYTVSNEEMHKHRALALIRPLKNFTGEYTCAVSTFQSEDARSALMLVVVPETGFVLKYYSSNISNLVTVLCSVYGIFPGPVLSLWINEHQLENVTNNVLLTQADLFDSSISIQLVLYESIQPDDVLKCVLGINGTEYRKTKETVFIDVNSKHAVEHNSVLDPVVSSTFETISSSTSSKTLSTSTTGAVTPSYGDTTSASVTTRLQLSELEELPPPVPSTSTNQPDSHAGRTHHLGTAQQPTVVRLRPNSARVLTVQHANPNIASSSDEVTNVLDFKEVPFNENLLYSSGGSALGDAGGCCCGWMLLLLLLRILAPSTCAVVRNLLRNDGDGASRL